MGGGIRGSLRDRLRGLLGAIDNVRRGGFGGVAARVIALGIVIAAGIWAAVRAGTRTKIPRPRYAATDPEAESLLRAEEDPRVASLFSRAGRFRPRFDASAAGVQVLMEGVDAAIASREDLAAMHRDAAAKQLAQEAKLAPRDVDAFMAAYLRLRGVVAGQEGSGQRAWRASKREVELFGRVLMPVADSLRSAR